MDNYEILWDYQSADIELSRFERKLQQSETRRELLKVRNFQIEQQNTIKKLEASLRTGQQRTKAIAEEIKKASVEFDELDESVTLVGEEDLGQIGKIIAEMDSINKKMTTLNNELAELNSRNAEHLKSLKGELEVVDVLEQQSRQETGYIIETRAMTVTEFIELNPVLKKYTAQQISKVLDKLGYQMIKKRVEGKASVARVRILPYKKYLNYNQVNY